MLSQSRFLLIKPIHPFFLCLCHKTSPFIHFGKGDKIGDLGQKIISEIVGVESIAFSKTKKVRMDSFYFPFVIYCTVSKQKHFNEHFLGWPACSFLLFMG
jgi:hypothetical protein